MEIQNTSTDEHRVTINEDAVLLAPNKKSSNLKRCFRELCIGYSNESITKFCRPIIAASLIGGALMSLTFLGFTIVYMHDNQDKDYFLYLKYGIFGAFLGTSISCITAFSIKTIIDVDPTN